MSAQQINGIRLDGDPPEIAGSYSGTLIVVGTAQGVWEEFDVARSLAPRAAIMAINLAVCGLKYAIQKHVLPVTHWASVHPDFFYIGNIYGAQDVIKHSTTKIGEVDHAWPIYGGGTSGLFGIKVGLALGYEKVLVCGCPLEDKIHIYDYPKVQPGGFRDRAVLMTWEQAKEEQFKGRVRSFSGWTKRILGEPTEEWLNVVRSGNL